MSDQRSHRPANNDFAAISNGHYSESKNSQNRLRSNKSLKQTKHSESVATTTWRKGVQTPKRRANGYTALNNVDSPGDGEVLQDIIWDPTSPTPVTTGKGAIRYVEISDIVNRIAPKDARSPGMDSPLLQWIGDSAVPCTPDTPQPRVCKKPTRQSKVDDLLKLARQFDKNMQRDKHMQETEQQNKEASSQNEACRPAPFAQHSSPLARHSAPSARHSAPLASTSQQLEEELHALFDCSTQRVSGRLSQSSSDSSRSQEASRPGGSTTITSLQSGLKSVDRTSSAPVCAANAGDVDKCNDFDDDWEDDDLLNDSLMLAMAQDSEWQNTAVSATGVQSNTRLNTNPSASEPTYVRGQSAQPQPSGLQRSCPKSKTSTRSTFRLEPNPLFQGQATVAKVFAPSLAVTEPPTPVCSVAPGPDRTMSDQTERLAYPAPDSVKDISVEHKNTFSHSDSLWYDGDDDDLLYQVCDDVERISSSQPEQPGPSDRQDIVKDRQWKTAAPSETDGSAKSASAASRSSAGAFVRSHSMPGASREHVNYQGWNIPTRGAGTGLPPVSHSHPGTAKPQQNSSSHHASFKRNLSDSAAICNKVFITGPVAGRCSLAEIEQKKQEALARRRLRMQTPQQTPQKP